MIDTAALRSKIIDLAIQGKLTEQLPTDGNAEELYQQIQAEKAKLIKDKKIKKEKPLPEITADEIPFEIPDNWKWVRWGDISQSIQYGYNAPALENGRIKMVRISDIQSNEVLWEDVPYCDIDEDSIETYLLQPNDILFARTGGTVGKSYLVEEVPEEAVYAGYLIRTRYSSLLSPRYLKYFMQGSLYWSQLRNGTIATAQPNCNGKTLGKMIVPLPPLSEQKRIVAKIDEVLTEIKIIDEVQSQYASNVDALKSKIIDAGIRGQLTEQLPEDGTAEELYQAIQTEKAQLIKDKKIKKEKPLPEITADEIPFEVPDNWKWVRFGDIGSYRKGPFGSALTKSMFVPKDDNTVKVYEQQHAIRKDVNIGNYYISREYFENSMRSFEVISGDIIVSCAGTIGETFILPNDIEQGIINQALMRVKLFSGIDKHFFQYFFDAYLKRNAREESNGSAIKNIPPLDVMKKWFIPLPPLSEQKRIVAKINDVFGALDERDRL